MYSSNFQIKGYFEPELQRNSMFGTIPGFLTSKIWTWNRPGPGFHVKNMEFCQTWTWIHVLIPGFQ